MENLNELLDKQIELLTDQRATLIHAITDADENSLGYETKVKELSKQVSATDYRIDELMQRIGSRVKTKTFNYAGIDYIRDSVIEGINEASENPTANAKDSDASLQGGINKLSHAGLNIFESKLKRAKS